MSEIVLIDEITNQVDNDTDPVYSTYYIRLSVEEDSDISLGAFKPISIEIDEGFGKSVIDCKVVFEDMVGSLINVKPIEGSFRFTLYIGRSPESTIQYNLRLRAVRAQNMEPGSSSGFRVELHLISDYWQEMIHNREFKCWRNTTYGGAISELLSQGEINLIHSSPTEGSRRQIIRPNWTCKEFLDWLKVRCKGTNGDTFFTYAALPERQMFFSTFSDLIHGKINESLDFEPLDTRRFVVGGEGLEGPNDRRRLMDFRVDMNYVDELMRGASGVSYGFYDYNSRQYVKGQHTFTESEEGQLTDWAMISEDQETIGTFVFGHRDSLDTFEIARDKVSREANKVHDVVTSTLGFCDVMVGELVDVLIPISPEFLDIDFNEYFSGKYVVSYRKTRCNLDTSTIQTIYKLTRQGINSVDVNTLTQSQRGKV